MELSLCNEQLADEGRTLAQQARIAGALGYVGLELAPATLAPEPHRIAPFEARAMREAVEEAGLRVTGLHWVLTAYPHLSITEPAKFADTRDVLRRLLDLCAELGGEAFVHGSPGSRRLAEGDDAAAARARLPDVLGPLAEHAAGCGVTYVLEPLAPVETPVVNTVEEARAVVRAVGSPALRAMIDCSAAGRAEAVPVADLIRREGTGGEVAHIHLNDTNRGGPGMGEDPFPEIVAALREAGWRRASVEPFRTLIDATTTAAVGAATIRALWAAAKEGKR
jgi:sugar phosphate isomerase/epimerase